MTGADSNLAAVGASFIPQAVGVPFMEDGACEVRTMIIECEGV